VDAIASITSALNKGIASAEARARVHEVQARLIGGPQLIAPHREVVREGSLVKIGQHGRRNRHYFILLNDILVYGDPVPLSGGRLAYKQTIHMEGVESVPDDGKAKVAHAFRIAGSPKSFLCLADDAASRDGWVRDCAAVVAASRARRTPVVAAAAAAAAVGLSVTPTHTVVGHVAGPREPLAGVPVVIEAPTMLPVPASGRRGSHDSAGSGRLPRTQGTADSSHDGAGAPSQTPMAAPPGLHATPSESSLRQRGTGEAVVGIASPRAGGVGGGAMGQSGGGADMPSAVVSAKSGKPWGGGQSVWAASPMLTGVVLVGATLVVVACVWWLRAASPATARHS